VAPHPEEHMTYPDDDSFVCPHCGSDVLEDDDFCSRCGEVFQEDTYCELHATRQASGVCIVCLKPFCRECGGRFQDRFLCHDHEILEIYEGMVRVFGSSDAVQVDFAKSSLEAAGLHPFVYSRKAGPISLGGPDYTLFRASGEYDGHIINEFKLMVPCQEFLVAMMKLRELDFSR
jgi:hypothetical protein